VSFSQIFPISPFIEPLYLQDKQYDKLLWIQTSQPGTSQTKLNSSLDLI
jgi:hypothetical protein